MTAAVMKTMALAKPSRASLERIETLLTLTLLAQVVGLAVRYAL